MSTAARTTLERGHAAPAKPRRDAIPKVTGEFAYSSDLQAADMLWGHTVRSPHAHARILEIDVSEALRLPGVHAVLTHEDVPGKKLYGLEFPDQPVLAIDRVRYFGEAVAIVAAEEPEQARRAAAAVRVEYEPLEPVADPERATEMEPLHVDWPAERHGDTEHPRPNVVRALTIRRGDPERRATSRSPVTTRSASRIRRFSARSPASRFRTARAESTSTSRRSGCTSTATRSHRASGSSRSRCGSTWRVWAARSAAGRISPSRRTRRCSRSARVGP